MLSFIVIVSSVFQIAQVVLMSVGLLLEADVEICLYCTSIFYQQTEPFKEVPKIETNVKQFPLLGCVYALMVQLYGTEFLNREDNAENVDGIETALYRETLYIDHLCFHDL